MNILLITQHFSPEEGAPATRWSWLSEALVARGHQLDVVVPVWGETGTVILADGVRVHRVKAVAPGLGLSQRAANEAASGLAALRLGMGSNPDVVVATVPSLVSLPIGWLLARTKRVPVVLDLRDAWPELFDRWREWGDYGSGAVDDRRWTPKRVAFGGIAAVFGWLRRHSDAVVVTSASLASRLRAEGISNVHVVRNAAHPESVAIPPPPAVRDDGLHVLYLGNVGRSQYLATAIHAVRLCQDRGARVQLRIVGQGAHAVAVSALATRLGVSVDFRERVAHAQIGEHLAWADTLLVLLRAWPEFDRTVPSKLYDALATGRHISASLAGEAASIVTEAAAGHVVPPQDAEALAGLWCRLAADRSLLLVPGNGPEWLAQHASHAGLGGHFADVVEALGHA